MLCLQCCVLTGFIKLIYGIQSLPDEGADQTGEGVQNPQQLAPEQAAHYNLRFQLQQDGTYSMDDRHFPGQLDVHISSAFFLYEQFCLHTKSDHSYLCEIPGC